MKEYDVIFTTIDQQGEEDSLFLIGIRGLTAARIAAAAGRERFPEAVAVSVEVIDSDQICDGCNGDGKLADATKPITREHIEWIPCPYCNGTGNESGRQTKTYLSTVL